MTERARPGLLELFMGFMRIGCLAFGGAAAFARRVVVEERRWLSEQDYAEMLALAQVLPGPNVGNFAVMFGRRAQGLPGAVAAVLGFLGLPLVMLAVLTSLYREWGQEPHIAAAMHGVAAAAAGMVLGTSLRMATRLKPPPEMIVLTLGVVLAALLHVPLPAIVLVAAPIGIAAALRRARVRGRGKDG